MSCTMNSCVSTHILYDIRGMVCPVLPVIDFSVGFKYSGTKNVAKTMGMTARFRVRMLLGFHNSLTKVSQVDIPHTCCTYLQYLLCIN